MFATLGDYIARYGEPDDTSRIETLLGDADVLVRAEIGYDPAAVTDEEVTVECIGRRRLQLPIMPVTDVTSVVVDGSDFTDFWWTRDGGLWRKGHGAWPCQVNAVVTFDGGYEEGDPGLAPLVALTCRLANTYVSDPGNVRSRSESVAGWSESVSYLTTVDGSRMRLEASDLAVIDSFKLPYAP